ncbi:MAG: DNA adenine methylase [Bacteroidales bacterium]|nr:DNA adenine methylase [Bacteroidales bacterium]
MKSQAVQLSLFADYNDAPQRRREVNVATVPQRSPFRYPGGKTWLVPIARQWFAQAKPGAHLIEPFAGGGIIGLTAAAEYQFERITLVERDDDMAAAWQTILSGNCQWLMERIASFQPTAENIRWAISRAADGIKERGFATIVRNRTNHGGILADGAGMIRNGENGKGLGSRWYPATLNKRIDSISRMRHRIEFIHGDAFEVMEQYIDDTRALFFIDPPLHCCWSPFVHSPRSKSPSNFRAGEANAGTLHAYLQRLSGSAQLGKNVRATVHHRAHANHTPENQG